MRQRKKKRCDYYSSSYRTITEKNLGYGCFAKIQHKDENWTLKIDILNVLWSWHKLSTDRCKKTLLHKEKSILKVEIEAKVKQPVAL